MSAFLWAIRCFRSAFLDGQPYVQVGPKQRQISVKDRDEYEFKPQVILMEIVHIYLHLQASDRFCSAVISDGRSFSSEMMGQSSSVLGRVGGNPKLIVAFTSFQGKLKVRECRYSIQ